MENVRFGAIRNNKVVLTIAACLILPMIGLIILSFQPLPGDEEAMDQAISLTSSSAVVTKQAYVQQWQKMEENDIQNSLNEPIKLTSTELKFKSSMDPKIKQANLEVYSLIEKAIKDLGGEKYGLNPMHVMAAFATESSPYDKDFYAGGLLNKDSLKNYDSSLLKKVSTNEHSNGIYLGPAQMTLTYGMGVPSKYLIEDGNKGRRIPNDIIYRSVYNFINTLKNVKDDKVSKLIVKDSRFAAALIPSMHMMPGVYIAPDMGGFGGFKDRNDIPKFEKYITTKDTEGYKLVLESVKRAVKDKEGPSPSATGLTSDSTWDKVVSWTSKDLREDAGYFDLEDIDKNRSNTMTETSQPFFYPMKSLTSYMILEKALSGGYQ